MPPIKTCVLGVGLAGLTFHIPFILALPDLFSLHAVLERNPGPDGGKVQERFHVSVKTYRTIEEVLSDDDIELVVVATPNHLHFEHAKAALEAGKHVLVDKPMTPTVAEAQQLEELAHSKNLVLYAYQNCRWNSDFLTLRRLLQDRPEVLGNIYEFESHFDRYRNFLKGTWKDVGHRGCGLAYDLGSHLIDQALVLFGRPSRLTAFISNVRGLGSPRIDDSFDIILHYDVSHERPLPLRVILRGSMLSVRSKQLRFVVRGDRGTFIKHGLDVQEAQIKTAEKPEAVLSDNFGHEPTDIWATIERYDDENQLVKETWPSTEKGRYIDLFRNLAAAIREGDEPQVKWKEATAVVELIELAHRSSAEGRTLPVP